ncbi:MAG: thiamine phosphate synthase, partial [Clostridia bacterium]|nr:thiamine phosphate synthase [Clostridia bacterium]
EICKKYNVPLIINDDVEAAIKSGADGVHVGAQDMAVAEIRKKASADFIIGATAKTVEQAKTAEARGADYLGVGAVFPSPTKRNAVRITAEQLKEISSAVSIPVVAIGGLTYNNIDIIENSGVSGAAVISAVFGVQDVKTAAEKLKEKLRNLLNTYLV